MMKILYIYIIYIVKHDNERTYIVTLQRQIHLFESSVDNYNFEKI